MKCPFCSSEKTKVIDKRENQSSSRRRRECLSCNKRFTTYEHLSKEKHPLKIQQIRKRDGTIALFDKERVYAAIFKAVKAVGGKDKKKAEEITNNVVEVLETSNTQVPNVEQIQDAIEKVLIEQGHAQVAKAFILYREKRKRVREFEKTFVDIDEIMGEYLQRSDWRVNENSNVDFSIGGLILYISGKITANYWLNLYSQKISQAHRNGDIHIHDLSMFSGYCAGWSLRQLITEGFGGIYGKLQTAPAKHLDTIVGQIVNFIGTLQNEWAGAQALSSFDTYLAPYIKKDNLTYKQVKQQMQRFLFNIATPSRWGTQTPFLNLTFDWTVPSDMANQKATIGKKTQSFTYGDCQKEMDMINKAFIETMIEGDASGRLFTFPIPTYNVTREFDWDSENSNLLFEMTAKYGIPYFQNFINSDLKPTDVRSMCCRLQLDLRELRKKTGGLFGSGESTGSIGVVTINLPRIGYLSETKEEFFERLTFFMEIAKESLEVKRKIITKNLDNGLLPFTKRYLGTFNHHFSTIGINGMNEACLNFLGKDISTKDGRQFALEVLGFMRNKISNFQEETKNIYNLEATPAEGTSYRFARMDIARYPDIITAGDVEPYYTNSSLLPVGYTDDIFEALEHQDELQCKYTGGTVLHGFLGERITDAETCKQLVKKIAYNFKLPYYTITPTFSVCKNHGYIRGEKESCPTCGEETEIYSRVVGYLRPVKSWNKGKKEEFKDRKPYSQVKAINIKDKYKVIEKPATNTLIAYSGVK